MTHPDHFAVIADIHGNVDALRAVLADIRDQGTSTILNLGDHFSGPLAAGETADLICNHDMLSIRGNHDRWLIEISPDQQSGSEAAAYRQLSAAHLLWLQQLPATMVLGDILMCHGTPGSDTDYLMERINADGEIHLDSSECIARRAGSTGATLILCGHTHVARRIDLPDGRTVLNPGSVGCPGYISDNPRRHRVQSGSPCASYAIVTRQETGWKTALRTVPYNPARMISLAQNSNRPAWAPLLQTGWLS